MKILIINFNFHHSAKAVRWLANFAARHVRSEAQREGWLAEFDQYPICLRIGTTRYHWGGHYGGIIKAFGLPYGSRQKTDLQPMDRVRDVLCRIGPASLFDKPVQWQYRTFKDMPEIMIADWQECLVALVAHELSHIKAGGRKDGEYYCELTASDAVDKFRATRPAFDAFMVNSTAKETERDSRIAARKSPEAIRSADLAKANRMLARWQSKAKLAATKIKKYQRAVRRLESKQP